MTTTRAPERSVGTTTPAAKRGVQVVLTVVGFLVPTAAGGFVFLMALLSGFDGDGTNDAGAWFALAAALVVAPWLVGWAVTRRAGWAVATLVVGALATLVAFWGAGTV